MNDVWITSSTSNCVTLDVMNVVTFSNVVFLKLVMAPKFPRVRFNVGSFRHSLGGEIKSSLIVDHLLNAF